jgi:DNA-binding GntR family transcriptional regulator
MQKDRPEASSPDSGTAIPSRALYQEVAGRLRQAIFSHEFAPGSWIDEQALAKAYGISRTPMREALKVLSAEGLVELKPRRGCYVAEISERDVKEIFPVLALLEGRCAYEATLKATPDDLHCLQQLHRELERRAAIEDTEGFFSVNQEFHHALHQISGNRWMLQFINDMRKVMRLVRFQSLAMAGRLEQSLAEHRDIMAAIQNGDAELAEKRMRDHLLGGRDAVVAPHSRMLAEAAAESVRQ